MLFLQGSNSYTSRFKQTWRTPGLPSYRRPFPTHKVESSLQILLTVELPTACMTLHHLRWLIVVWLQHSFSSIEEHFPGEFRLLSWDYGIGYLLVGVETIVGTDWIVHCLLSLHRLAELNLWPLHSSLADNRT